MVVVVLLLCFSGFCWALLLLSWKRHLTRPPEERREIQRRAANVVELQRERWRRVKSRDHRAASKLR